MDKAANEQNGMAVKSSQYMKETEVMNLFGIRNKSHFSKFRSQHQIPCYRVGRHYIYLPEEIHLFVQKFKANRR